MNDATDSAAPPQAMPRSDDAGSLGSICDDLRKALKQVELTARRLKDHQTFQGEQKYPGQHGEMIAQSMLAVRALEEARMRLGKVKQYSGDGVSIYDKA